MPPVSRASLPLAANSFRVTIKPTLRFDITTIPPRCVQATIDQVLGSTNYCGFVVHRPSNTITVNLPSLVDAQKMCAVTQIPLDANEHVPVQIYFASGPDTLRCVVYHVDSRSPSEEVRANIRCSTHSVLQARPLGRRGSYLLTLQGPLTLPEYLTYYGAIIKPQPFRPRRIFCYHCHKEGHMQNTCPNPAAVADMNEPIALCALCKSADHDMRSPACPKKKRTRPSRKPPGKEDIPTSNRFAALTCDETDFPALPLLDPPAHHTSSQHGSYAQATHPRGSNGTPKRPVHQSHVDAADEDAVLDNAIAEARQRLDELTQLREQRRSHPSRRTIIPRDKISNESPPISNKPQSRADNTLTPNTPTVDKILALMEQVTSLIVEALRPRNG